jgi:hypothetical protein
MQGVFVFEYYVDEEHSVRRIWLKDFNERGYRRKLGRYMGSKIPIDPNLE